MQIIHNNFANFFGNDQPKLDLISANNQQFEIWPKWTILTSVKSSIEKSSNSKNKNENEHDRGRKCGLCGKNGHY